MTSHRRQFENGRAGLSLVELVVSTMLVGLVMVGALNCLGVVVRDRTEVSLDANGPQLAQQLMTEILNADYIDDTSPTFGVELGESEANRNDFDDVDDFHGWSGSPPQHRDGSLVANASSWMREVSVEWVEPGDPTSPSGTDQGVKRIIVTVRRSGQVVARLYALRTSQYSP